MPNTASANKKIIVDYTEQFAKKIQAYFEALELGKGERTSYVLDRKESQEKSLIIDEDCWLTTYSSNLTNTILERLKNQDFENIFNQLQVQYVNTKEKISLDEFIESVKKLLTSKSQTVVLQMQDYLMQNEKYKMNTPGKAEGSWEYRVPQNYKKTFTKNLRKFLK